MLRPYQSTTDAGIEMEPVADVGLENLVCARQYSFLPALLIVYYMRIWGQGNWYG